MTAEVRAFGGPLDGQWFPLDDEPPIYFAPVELDAADVIAGPADVIAGPAAVTAPAPAPRRYLVRKFGHVDPDTGARWSGFALVENAAGFWPVSDGLNLVARLALLSRGHR